MENWQIIPVAIRPDGEPVRIHMPENLTAEEAQKVARVVIAYATSVSGTTRKA